MQATDERALTAEQAARYAAEGYLVAPDLLSDEEVRAFLAHEAQPAEAKPREGLRTHTVDPRWRAMATHPKIVGIARRLLDGRPMIVQTMFLNKAAAGGQGIALHQDRHYIPHEPHTLMACWVALADTDADNGGLCVVPGSHRGGLRKASRTQSGEHVSWETQHLMRDRDGREWNETLVSFEIEGVDPASILRLSVPRGAGVFFTGMTIHGSFANHSSDRPRPAFAVHYVREGTWVYRADIQETVPAE